MRTITQIALLLCLYVTRNSCLAHVILRALCSADSDSILQGDSSGVMELPEVSVGEVNIGMWRHYTVFLSCENKTQIVTIMIYMSVTQWV